MTARTGSAAAIAGSGGVMRLLHWARSSPWCYLVGMNFCVQAPFWILQHFYSFQRAVFNEDLMLALLVCTVSTRAGWVVMAAALLVDVASIASWNYHFKDVEDFLGTLRYAHLMNFTPFLNLGSIGLALLSLGYLFLLARRLRRKGALLPAIQTGMIALVVALDMSNGSMRLVDLGRDEFRQPYNVGGSPFWNLYESHASAARDAQVGLRPMASGARESLLQWHRHHPEGSLLVVLVESMGQPSDPVLQQWLARQIQSPQVLSRWQVTMDSERFSGSTTHGELRVLCGLDGAYSRLDNSNSQDCLPRLLAAEQFVSNGYHGFRLSMFDRDHWWSVVGLQPHAFDYRHSAAAVKDCHAVFHGICDREVLRTAIGSVQAPRRLAYVVTLDTHLPLSGRRAPPGEELAALCEKAHVSESSCALTDHLGAFLRGLGAQLAASEATPYVAIVGDHAPPFIQVSDREGFLPEQVPLILLEPHDANVPADRGSPQ